jgi:two-component system KDP operon response regulator KdpE
MRRPHVLIVDDELAIIKFVRANLQAEDYEVLTAMDGCQALETVEMELPDLVVLDIMLPIIDGFEVCRRLREWSQIPIIMLSARGNDEDKVKCLDLGADDYITKPFSAHELMARVRAVLRRAQAVDTVPAQPSFIGGDLEINFAARRVSFAGNEVKLTPIEYQLLQELAINAGKVLTHMHLLNKVWGPEYREERDYLHTYVRRLRRKLEPDPAEPCHLLSVAGVGYQFSS